MRKSRATGESSTTRTMINWLLLSVQGGRVGLRDQVSFSQGLAQALTRTSHSDFMAIRYLPLLWVKIVRAFACQSVPPRSLTLHPCAHISLRMTSNKLL